MAGLYRSMGKLGKTITLCKVYSGHSKSKGQSQGELSYLGIGMALGTEGSMVVLSSFLNLLHSSVV